MGSSATVPKFRRSWTRIRDYSTERAFRELVRTHDVSHVPTIMLKQFVALGVRASQYNRKIRELEKEAEVNRGEMSDGVWARYTFLVTEHRRCALAMAVLAKSIFGDERRAPAIELTEAEADEIIAAAAKPEAGADESGTEAQMTAAPVEPPESED